MQTKEITLFVFDLKDNFEKSKSSIGTEGSSFKKIICVQDATDFEHEFAQLSDNDLVFMVVHVFYTDKINGIKRFKVSGISNNFPKLGYMYVSEGDHKAINIMMINEEIEGAKIYKYHQIQSNLAERIVPVYTKKEITGSSLAPLTVDIAVIAALYEGEYTSMRGFLEDAKKIDGFESLLYAKLKNSEKRILIDFQQKMGMVEATALSTIIIKQFSPKYLIMVGVCGGRASKGVKLLDLIIPSKVFDYQTGKYHNGEFKPYLRSCNINNKRVLAAKDEILKSIEDYVGHTPLKDKLKTISVHNKSMACGNIVVKTKDYIDNVISSADEETEGVDMESYGVARTSEMVENAKTTAIIIKSVMDYTDPDKNDKDKDNAAYFSACFTYFLIKDHL